MRLLVVLVALAELGRLVERDQVDEVALVVRAQTAGLGEALRHVAAQVAFALDHQLEVVRRFQPALRANERYEKPRPLPLRAS